MYDLDYAVLQLMADIVVLVTTSFQWDELMSEERDWALVGYKQQSLCKYSLNYVFLDCTVLQLTVDMVILVAT